MTLTLIDRQDIISRTISAVRDVQDELQRQSIDDAFIDGKLRVALKLLRDIDRDGPAPDSIGLILTEEVRAAYDRGSSVRREAVTQAMAALRSQAVTSNRFDAVPNVYPYSCEILTFDDGSQCLIPAENDRNDTLPFYLVQHYSTRNPYLAGISLPLVSEDVPLTKDDEKIEQILTYSYSRNVQVNYTSQWKYWASYASEKQVPVMPAQAIDVVDWLRHRVKDEGKKISSAEVGLKALKAIHKAFKQPHPCDDKEVKSTVKALRREYGQQAEQADGVTRTDVELIEATACLPRIGRGGKLETKEQARKRGLVDIAITKTTYSALLRPSEAATLRWRDIKVKPNGTGTLFIASSKTDQYREGKSVFIPADTVTALLAMKGKSGPDDLVFALNKRSLSRRIKASARTAGIEGRFTAHSGRVGMARDLVAFGASMPQIMQAGRWSSETMPILYARNELADRTAVARFSEKHEDERSV